jgi:hypothetical protein
LSALVSLYELTNGLNFITAFSPAQVFYPFPRGGFRLDHTIILKYDKGRVGSTAFIAVRRVLMRPG